MWDANLSKTLYTCDCLLKKNMWDTFTPFLLTQGHLYLAQPLHLCIQGFPQLWAGWNRWECVHPGPPVLVFISSCVVWST